MHSVLFHATIGDKQPWGVFVTYAVQNLQPYASTFERLADNIWLLNLRLSLSPLGELIHQADALGVAYRILPFDQPPEWLPAVSGQAKTGP